jgi:type VI secretion system protein VasJ
MTLREDIAAKIAPLVAPIAGAEPSGADPSFDPDFERIKAEIDKLTSVDGKEPAWREIREVGGTLLTKRAKDLRVAGWLGVAVTKLDGWKGLAETLATYDGLARGFWDTMYPDAKRPRGRVMAFGWLSEVTAKQLQGLDVTFADGDAVRASDEILRELETLLAEKLGAAYQGPGPLRRLLREKVAAIPAPPAATPPADAQASTNGAAAPPRAEERADAGPALAATAPATGDADAAVQESGQAMLRAAAALRQADPARAQAYRLQRWGAWAAIQNPPPADGDKTRIRPPPDQLTKRLGMLRDSQKWVELLLATEDATGKFLFWLDLHKQVASTLDRLGAAFMGAREVVGREVIAFVTRFPSIPSMAFQNGTPFADAATKTWLDEETRRWGGSSQSAGSAAASAEDEEVAKRFADADALVTEGKLAEGLGVASALAARGADGRTRFRASLAVGKMALKGSKPEVARAILERLDVEVTRHELEIWEPALCASLYASLLTAMRDGPRAAKPSPEAANREQAIFEKLCRLDPAAALKFAQG